MVFMAVLYVKVENQLASNKGGVYLLTLSIVGEVVESVSIIWT